MAGNTLLAGSITSIQGTLGVSQATTLSSSLTVQGSSTFNSSVTFTNPAAFTSDTSITSTTNSTSLSTGALRVAGGFAVIKDTFLGGLLNTAGPVTFQNTLGVTGVSTLSGVTNITNTTETTAYTNGALVVSGGVGISGNLRLGSGNLFLAGQLVLNRDRTSGIVNLASPTAAMYINQNGGYDVFVNSGSTSNYNVANTTNTNSTTGFSVLHTADTTSASTGAIKVAGGVGITKSLYIGANLTVTGTSTFNNQIQLTNTTQSVSSSTGSFLTAGGLGVAK